MKSIKYVRLYVAIETARKATNNDKVTRFVVRDANNKYVISTNYTMDMNLVSVIEFHPYH